MDFSFSEEEEALRLEVQSFIQEHFTEEVLADLTTGKRGRGFGPRAAPIFRKIAERGWNAIAWPKAYGGQGGSRIPRRDLGPDDAASRRGVLAGDEASGLRRRYALAQG